MRKLGMLLVIGISVGLICIGGFLPIASGETTEELKAQIEALQRRVEELESARAPMSGDESLRAQPSWDPFAEMYRMQEEMNRMFQGAFSRRGSGFGPGVFSNNMSFESDLDIQENGDGYEIRFDLQGLNKDKVDIQINEHSITVKGEYSRDDRQEGLGNYFHSQKYGSFMKTIPLPVDADTAKVKTEKEGDSLVIRLPKKSR